MTIRKITATAKDALVLSTKLLQRSRLADPHTGIWEAADIQWSWRKRRESDDVEQPFWIDDHGPVAGIWITSSSNSWQLDPIIVPHSPAPDPETIWNHTLDVIANQPDVSVDVPIADTDSTFQELAKESGFVAADTDYTGWMNVSDTPHPAPVADGFQIVDRTVRTDMPHPMSDRNGEEIAERLNQCSLYDPSLDLSLQSPDGLVAGYSLFWFDPVTKIGLVEPVRVHDDFQRKGLARAMVTHGINRLVTKGAERIKVSWETEAAGALYLGVGFQQQSTTTWYASPSQNQPNVE